MDQRQPRGQVGRFVPEDVIGLVRYLVCTPAYSRPGAAPPLGGGAHLTVVLGNERFEVPAGGIAWLPRGVPHTFANLAAEPVRVVGMVVPSGLEGMFAEQTEYFRSLKGPPDPEAIAEIGRRYEVTVVGPPVAIPEG